MTWKPACQLDGQAPCFGLLAAINEALDRDDVEALAAVLARNIYEGDDMDQARTLAAYVVERDAELRGQPAAAILKGELHFGDIA